MNWWRQVGSSLVALLVLTASLPLLAQPVIFIEHDPYQQLQKLDTPWKLPDELTAQLAERAAEYEAAAQSLECSETTRRVKYPGSGRLSEGKTRDATFLLGLEDGSMVPVRVPGKSIGRSGKSAVPTAHAWTQLFALRNQSYFSYRDLGERPYSFGKARRIQFRGALPYEDGADIRQWEGTVLIDSFTLLPIRIDAEPLNLWPRLEYQRDRYARSFKFGFFGLVIRFKKKPLAERVHVRYDMQSNGLTLPIEAYVEKIEKVLPDQAVVRSRVTSIFEHRFSEDDAVSLSP